MAAALALACATPFAARAADEHNAEQHVIAQAAQAGDTHKGHGVVNSVNAPAGRVNITHDAIESLKWPKMKMSFKVQDPALLEGLTAGTVVDFDLQKSGDDYKITRIVPAK
jgi:Cu/Ag efflux protein CusF